MNIKLWNDFTKRENSTMIPPAAGAVTKNVVLKEETSIDHPVFILNEPVSDYTYIQAFGKYYFVTDVVNLDGHRCEISAALDVLASYRDDIFSYPAFVERAASAYDVFVNDPQLSQRQLYAKEDFTVTSLSSFYAGTDGCFLVECLAKDHGVVLYASHNLEPYKFILAPGVYSSQDKDDWIVSQISQSFDLDVYIGSVKWFPFKESNLNGQTLGKHFPIGPVDLGLLTQDTNPGAANYWNYTIYEIKQSYRKHTNKTLVLPTSGNFNDFRDCNNQFTQYNLYLPGVGIVSLDSAIIGYAIHNNQTINVDIEVDLISGEVTYILGFPRNVGQSIFARYSGNVSVDVPIGKSAVDTVKSAKMFAGSVGSGALHGGVVGAALGAVVGGVEAIYNHFTPDTSMVGGSGNKSELLAYNANLILSRRQFGAKDFPTAVAGRPLMKNVVLRNLAGYVKCGNASVPVNAFDSVREKINRYLNSGFYIE